MSFVSSKSMRVLIYQSFLLLGERRRHEGRGAKERDLSQLKCSVLMTLPPLLLCLLPDRHLDVARKVGKQVRTQKTKREGSRTRMDGEAPKIPNRSKYGKVQASAKFDSRLTGTALISLHSQAYPLRKIDLLNGSDSPQTRPFLA